MYPPNPKVFYPVRGDGAGGVSKQACRKARSAEQAQCRAGVRRTDVFFTRRPVHRSSLAISAFLARELAPETVAAARPTGGHFCAERGSAKKRALPGREWGRVSFGVVCDVFCGEWRRVSESASGLGVLSSAGDGGESASGGAKGEWG